LTTASLSLLHTPIQQQNGIDKLVRLLEDGNEAQFNAEQYMQLYT